MSDGKTHARASTAALIASIGIAIPVGLAIGPAIPGAFVGGMVCGLLMPPDLDLPVRTEDEKRMLRKNKRFGILWVGFWASYGQMFRHRGISHWPIIGTLTRVLWSLRHLLMLAGALWVLQYLGYIIIVKIPQIPYIDPVVLISFFAGWVIQDFVHLGLDGILI